MAKKTVVTAAPPAMAADVAGGQGPSPLSAAIRVIGRVLGVGCVVAKRHALKLSADEQAQIVARYELPEAHDEIRKLVLDAQQRKEKPTDEPSSHGDGA